MKETKNKDMKEYQKRKTSEKKNNENNKHTK